MKRNWPEIADSGRSKDDTTPFQLARGREPCLGAWRPARRGVRATSHASPDFLLGAAAALSACVSNDPVADPGDACEIFETQEGWWRSVKRAERRWGAPPALQLAIMRQESGFNHNARPPRGRILFIFPGRRASTAHGYAQALSSTWEEYERARGDDGLDRNEFSDAADFVAWYAGRSHQELGISYADARSHYLAYHEGRGGYRRETYRGNATLMASASRVQSYYDTYAAQIDRCDGRLNRGWLPF